MKVPPAYLLHLPFTYPIEAKPTEPVVWTETGQQPARTTETEIWIAANREELARRGVRYVRKPVYADFDNYSAFLSAWFDPVTLVHMDHDVVPTVQMVLDLVRCAYPACTQVYRLAESCGAPLSTVLDTPVYEDVEGTFSMAIDTAKEIPQWCDRTGFGLVKMDFGQRIRHPLPPAATTWVGFDSWYCGFIKQREPCFKWHVHTDHGGPMRHEH